MATTVGVGPDFFLPSQSGRHRDGSKAYPCKEPDSEVANVGWNGVWHFAESVALPKQKS